MFPLSGAAEAAPITPSIREVFRVYRFRVAVGIAGFYFATSAAIAGPFGLDFGAPITNTKIVRQVDATTYYISPPEPNSEFESYAVVATPNDGICKIIGIGKTHIGAGETEIRAAFDSLTSALTLKYGTPSNSFDFLHVGAIWKNPGEFAMSLRQHERSLVSFWDLGITNTNQIGSILLEADGTARDKTFLRLGYEGRNYKSCRAADKAKDQHAL
jgi:hypothetical protein